MRKLFSVFLLLFALLQSGTIVAQDFLKNTDLKTINVDYLSDNDIAKIKDQLQNNNMTIDQVEPMALAKGMSKQQFSKLKIRLEDLGMVKKKEEPKKTVLYRDKDSIEDVRKQEIVENKKIKDSVNALIFGSELFDNPTLNFQPNLNIATPVNYVLGPGDELDISVYGVQDFNASIPVTVEGKVSIQYVGEIAVAGMSIEAATQKIKIAMSKVYSSVRSGQSQVAVSLTKIRTIKVTIIGGKQPGNYSLSSLSTVYNALFLAGGPAKNGSYRNIELLRNNKIIKKIDLYNFLINGNQSDNVGLKDDDVIRIPAYTTRVTVEGYVKRPGLFEMKTGETFKDLLSFASGFNEFAYTASVNVLQKNGKEYRVKDINSLEFNTYQPLSGDVFQVTKILNRFENRIKIVGAVFRPSTYSFYEGMKVSDLIAQADGLKDDAYTSRATILRLKSDMTTEVTNVNLKKALEGDSQANISLKREDIVTVYSILDFKEEYNVTINGEIKKPEVYDYHENLTLNDLIVLAGGLTGSASKRVEIARMIKSEKLDDTNPNRVQLFNLEISADKNEQMNNFPLEPFDVVNIRRMAVYEKPEMVTISGAVAYTGKYVLASKKEKILDIVNRAGGLTSTASLDGVKIKRPFDVKQIEDLENVNLNLDDKESLDKKESSEKKKSLVEKDTTENKLTKKLKQEKFATIPVNWRKIIKDPNDNTNVTLFPGDEIEVSTYSETVKITGNVLFTSEIPYEKGKGFNYYISAVGGIDAKGWKKQAIIIYPNGKTAISNNYFFIRSYPKVLPGSQIVVPEKPEIKKMSTAEFVSIGSVVASIALLIVTAFK